MFDSVDKYTQRRKKKEGVDERDGEKTERGARSGLQLSVLDCMPIGPSLCDWGQRRPSRLSWAFFFPGSLVPFKVPG